MASLIDGQTANLFCGATVIGRHYALTSARCLANVDPSQMALLVGDHDITALGRRIPWFILRDHNTRTDGLRKTEFQKYVGNISVIKKKR